MSALNDMTGRRFGRLVVLERRGSNRRGQADWLCRCDCSVTKVVNGRSLVCGDTKSCGCFQRDLVIARNTKHGRCLTLTYRAWKAMRQRCNNPKHPKYARYGGRGIKVRFSDFEAFRAYMGECLPGYDLHRLDNDGDYEPGNCVWLAHAEHRQLHARRRKASAPPLPSEVARL